MLQTQICIGPNANAAHSPFMCVQALRQLMRDHGWEGRTPKEEFKALLASGALSPATHQFLTSTLGQHGCSDLQLVNNVPEWALSSSKLLSLCISNLPHQPCNVRLTLVAPRVLVLEQESTWPPDAPTQTPNNAASSGLCSLITVECCPCMEIHQKTLKLS